MSKFFVGQRVRHRYSCTGRVPAGAEGSVAEIDPGHETLDGVGDCRVLWDGLDATNLWSVFDQLEPILPSGHRSGDYSYPELMDRLKAGEVECV